MHAVNWIALLEQYGILGGDIIAMQLIIFLLLYNQLYKSINEIYYWDQRNQSLYFHIWYYKYQYKKYKQNMYFAVFFKKIYTVQTSIILAMIEQP